MSELVNDLSHGIMTIRLRIAEAQSRKQIEALNIFLKQRADELVQANKELEAFSYSVSHDLRNPLNAIVVNTAVLSMETGAKRGTDIHTAISHIERSTERMKQVISDLLTLSGISRRKTEYQNVNLSEMVQASILELKTSDPYRETEILICPNLIVNADPGLLRILIDNLTRNAWKFTSKKMITRIELGSMEKSGKLCYFIRDNGAGFDMEESNKLFNPYVRLHSAHDFNGTGIGLAIARQIVEKHNGAIWAEGEKDKGATFYFLLPL